MRRGGSIHTASRQEYNQKLAPPPAGVRSASIVAQQRAGGAQQAAQGSAGRRDSYHAFADLDNQPAKSHYHEYHAYQAFTTHQPKLAAPPRM